MKEQPPVLYIFCIHFVDKIFMYLFIVERNEFLPFWKILFVFNIKEVIFFLVHFCLQTNKINNHPTVGNQEALADKKNTGTTHNLTTHNTPNN